MPDMSSTRPEVAVSAEKVKTKRSVRKIILSLENCLYPEEKFKTTPSQNDGLNVETETDLRIWGCELIQTAGILLKLPQVAMATGQVLLQRFYYCKSLARYPVETTAMACVCLASKIEEFPRHIRDIINVFNHIKQIIEEKPIKPVILDQNYINLKNQVIKAERRVLKELGFCVHVKHPHKIIVMYLQVLQYENNSSMMQLAWNYMNDALRTDVFVRYEPEVIACACIYLTARKLQIALPNNPKWFALFGVNEMDIKRVSVKILQLYERAKPNIEQLEKTVEDVRRMYQEMKIKSRETDVKASPKPKDSPKSMDGSHNAWGGFISRSGNHNVQAVEVKKRSPTRSPSPIKSKKRRTRSRSATRYKKRSYSPKRDEDEWKRDKKRGSGKKSRSRSRTPAKKRRSDKYYDKYDKYDKKYDRENDYRGDDYKKYEYKHKKHYSDDKHRDDSSDYEERRSKTKKDKRR